MASKISLLIFLLWFCSFLSIIESNPRRTIREQNINPRSHSSGRKKPNKKLPCISDFNHTFEALEVDQDKQLELVHLVFRHGVRTPADTYPTDPYVNNTFEPYGWGHITNYGKCRLYDTGKWIRTRYNSFLGKQYFPDLVHAQATGVARTHMSIAIILASLFKPKGTSMEWNKALNWQPIQIVAEELNKDTLLLVRINCPRYYEALNEVLQKPEVKKYLEDNQELYKNLTKITGMEIKNPEDVSSLYSTLVSEKAFGLVLPDWTKGYFPDKMQDNAEYAFILNLYTDELKRIKGGPFLKKMSNEWREKSENKLLPKGRKMFLYAGHDSTIVNILAAFNVWNKQFPGYNIMAIFELYKNTKTGEYDVKVYQKNEGQNPIPLTLPGCDISCPLEKVLKQIDPMQPTETLKNECSAKDPNATTPKPSGPLRNKAKTLDFNHTFAALKVDKDKQLELVHIVFRHGVRTPVDTYPTDPYNNNTFSPFGWGQLTNDGKSRLYDTGKWIRTRYNKFLGEEYFPDLVHAQSTDVARAHMSIAIILASLFKPKGTKMDWNKELNWQPIQIVAEELNKDTLLLVRINCPRYFEALHEVLQKPEVKKYLEDNQELYKNLTKITGMEIKNPLDVGSLYSTLVSEKAFGLVLPDWTKEYFPHKMQDNAEYAYILNLYTDELKRIKGGPFLKKMSNEWRAKSENKLLPKERKMFLYAGHDFTIVNILAALNVWNKQFPCFNIMAIFELYKNTKTGEYDVKVYQKNEGKNPIPLTLPGCDISCPLEKVLKLIEPMLTSKTPTNACNAQDSNLSMPSLTGP